ncbi:amylo-alpha-1,6-glucosidase [Rugosimonospora africana]|uniref:Glycogen debranching protein n=1 Tax=Rugosimonospora africana TaxID=556532 RepID=A0A8J3QKZ0_9ACTN|nr:amylo-alpha-1,6-glucosidase [Rugosimonospora africana]GIH12869.1 glycogen debranching protein [Rugosimonospora africana]
MSADIVLGTQVCGRLDEGAGREWLLADGRGGYAMGTIAGLRTRRYHGLLVVAGDRPGDRHVGLAALDPVVELPSGARIRLGTHEWAGGAVSPAGYTRLERFDLTDGLPRWRWRIGDVVLERELAMARGSGQLGVVHRLLAGGPVRLCLEALCTWRDAHGSRDAGGGPLPAEHSTGGVTIAGAYRLSGPGWHPGGEWYRDAYLREEAARGLPPQEDLWYAGQFVTELSAGQVAEVTACGDATASAPEPATAIVAGARARAARLVAGAADPVDARLRLAADAFVIDGPDVVAGYPWFGSWSRDTMISYRGLFLATGRIEEGRALLRRYAGTLRDGLLANTADTGRVEYNTVDGTLWFVHAVDEHVRYSGDTDLAAELVPALDGIRDAHVAGTGLGIRADPADGLLTQGRTGYALTWMDARVDGLGVTPRIGKPVEVNALWVNALRAMVAMRERVGAKPEPTREAQDLANAASTSFLARFPAPTGWLYDVVDGPAGDDPSLRPNQLIAYALRHAPCHGRRPHPALDAELLTPLGLRTLSPGAGGYLGRHRGGPAERDRAYHQGTVWPWLLGPYIDARRAAGLPVDGLLDGLVTHLDEYGLGSVSETADGDAPHGATGCPFQAWSVAELLRLRRFGDRRHH